MTAGGKESGKGEEDRADREGEGGMRASAVLGTTSARSVISMRPAGAPPMVMSKKTTGVLIFKSAHMISDNGESGGRADGKEGRAPRSTARARRELRCAGFRREWFCF